MKLDKGLESNSEISELLSKMKTSLVDVLADEPLHDLSRDKLRSCLSTIEIIFNILKNDHSPTENFLKPLHAGLSRSMESLNPKPSKGLSASRSTSNLAQNMDVTHAVKGASSEAVTNIVSHNNSSGDDDGDDDDYAPVEFDGRGRLSSSLDENSNTLRTQKRRRKSTKRRIKIMRWLKKTLFGNDGQDVAVIGDIYKMDDVNNNLIKVWCLVRNRQLYCYRSIMDETIEAVIALDNSHAVVDGQNSTHKFLFYIEENSETRHTFVANSDREMTRWMEIVKNKGGSIFLWEFNEESEEHEEDEDEDDEDDDDGGYCFPSGQDSPIAITVSESEQGYDCEDNADDGGYVSVLDIEDEIVRRKSIKRTKIENLPMSSKAEKEKQRRPAPLPKSAACSLGRKGQQNKMSADESQEKTFKFPEGVASVVSGGHCDVDGGDKQDLPKTNGAISMANSRGVIMSCEFTASSSLQDSPPSQGILDQRSSAEMTGAWRPETNDKNQFLEIDLGEMISMTAIGIQGRPDYDKNGGEYVKSYTVLHSNTRDTWTVYKSHGKAKVFQGNSNPQQECKKSLKHMITARYVRISPNSWCNHIALRVALYKEQVNEETGNSKSKANKKKMEKTKSSSPDCDTSAPSTPTTPVGAFEKKKKAQLKKINISSPLIQNNDGLTKTGSDQVFFDNGDAAKNVKDAGSEITNTGPQSLESRIKLRENLLAKEKKEQIIKLEGLRKRMDYAKDKMIVVSHSNQHKGDAADTEEEYLTANLELVKVKKRLTEIETDMREARLHAAHHREQQEEMERPKDFTKPKKKPVLTRRLSKEIKITSDIPSPSVDKETFNPAGTPPPPKKVMNNVKMFETLGNK